VNSVYEAKGQIVATSNKSLADLASKWGGGAAQKIVRRIGGDDGHVVQLADWKVAEPRRGGDRRGEGHPQEERWRVAPLVTWVTRVGRFSFYSNLGRRSRNGTHHHET
jgi:hypothetical protein